MCEDETSHCQGLLVMELPFWNKREVPVGCGRREIVLVLLQNILVLQQRTSCSGWLAVCFWVSSVPSQELGGGQKIHYSPTSFFQFSNLNSYLNNACGCGSFQKTALAQKELISPLNQF